MLLKYYDFQSPSSIICSQSLVPFPFTLCLNSDNNSPTMKTCLLLLSVSAVLSAYLTGVSAEETKTALVGIANGTDTIEAIITIDVLRRAGVNVTVGGKGCEHVVGNHGVVITADVVLHEDIGDFDAVIFPGGIDAARKFAECEATGKYLKKAEKDGKVIAAICAAPVILKAHGIGNGKKITSGPKVADEIKEGNNYEYCEERVVCDDNLITSRAPGTAFEFALAIVKKLLGEEKKEEIEKPLLLK